MPNLPRRVKTAVRVAAIVIIAALLAFHVVKIADEGLRGNWVGVVLGIVALSMVFTINPDHKSKKPPSTGQADVVE